ncbi:GrpB family protein [Desulfosarcina sp. OttesenSCG-928-A07]|nr:GrpB family protein [Desulfosarcina sp. OttesenSCG-928-A07]
MLGNELITVFHIGSTAVEGLKANPIIDIMLVVENIHRLDAYAFDFETLGDEVMGKSACWAGDFRS